MERILKKGNLGKCILVLVLVSSVFVLAGDVVVQEGLIEGVKFKSTGCTATGSNAVALGTFTTTIGNSSTAMGNLTTASGPYSTAMGSYTTASGSCSTAMGGGPLPPWTIASGNCSTAIGPVAEATGDYSTAIGAAVTAGPADWTTAMGKYSTNDVANSFTVGYGTSQNPAVDFRVRSGLVNVYGDLDVSQKVTMGTLVLPSSSWDPGSPVEGQIYLNTTDYKVKIYVNGEWKTVKWQ